jgi:hypothetical protein
MEPEGSSPCSQELSNDPYPDFLFPNLKITTKGTRFEVVSSIQQTVTREVKAIPEAFSRTFNSCMSDANVRKWAGTTLNDGINKYFLIFFMVSVRELNCHASIIILESPVNLQRKF